MFRFIVEKDLNRFQGKDFDKFRKYSKHAKMKNRY